MTATAVIASTACTDLGYRGAPIAGTAYTDQHVAEATVKAIARQRPNFPLVCGSSPKEEKRRNRRFQEAVKVDVGKALGLTLVGILLFLIGGPAALVVAIVSTIFEWYLSKQLDERWQGMFSAATAEAT